MELLVRRNTMSKKPRVYLAGPDVFRKDPNVEYFNEMKEILGKLGIVGLSPFDSEVKDLGGNKIENAFKIYEGNVALLDSCQAVLANCTPFRGPSMDVGTAFEIGYAVAKKIPVFCFSDTPLNDRPDSKTYKGRIDYLKSVGVNYITGPYSEVEDFGLCENLMIACSTESWRTNALASVYRLRAHLLEKGLILNEPNS
jgi:nucleoside 2-deoxyribosyltransferase